MSTLKDKLNQDYITAMKEKTANKGTLSLMRAAIKQVEVDTRQELNDEDVIKILKSEAKKRKDSIEAYSEGGRDDLVAQETAELKIIEAYLPAQMDEVKIREIVKQIIEEMQAGPQDMGKVMGRVMGEIKKAGDADGKIVQDIVKETLN